MSGSGVAGIGLAAVLALGPGAAAVCSLLCDEGAPAEADPAARPASGSGHHHDSAPAAPPAGQKAGQEGEQKAGQEGAVASAPGGCCEHPAASAPASRVAARAAASGARGDRASAGSPVPLGRVRAEERLPARFASAGGGGDPPPPARSAPVVLRL